MNLAIKGDSVRHTELIMVLKRLGGKNTSRLLGNNESFYYFIRRNGEIDYHADLPEGYYKVTLERFFKENCYMEKLIHEQSPWFETLTPGAGGTIEACTVPLVMIGWSDIKSRVEYTVQLIGGAVCTFINTPETNRIFKL